MGLTRAANMADRPLDNHLDGDSRDDTGQESAVGADSPVDPGKAKGLEARDIPITASDYSTIQTEMSARPCVAFEAKEPPVSASATKVLLAQVKAQGGSEIIRILSARVIYVAFPENEHGAKSAARCVKLCTNTPDIGNNFHIQLLQSGLVPRSFSSKSNKLSNESPQPNGNSASTGAPTVASLRSKKSSMNHHDRKSQPDSPKTRQSDLFRILNQPEQPNHQFKNLTGARNSAPNSESRPIKRRKLAPWTNQTQNHTKSFGGVMAGGNWIQEQFGPPPPSQIGRSTTASPYPTQSEVRAMNNKRHSQNGSKNSPPMQNGDLSHPGSPFVTPHSSAVNGHHRGSSDPRGASAPTPNGYDLVNQRNGNQRTLWPKAQSHQHGYSSCPPPAPPPPPQPAQQMHFAQHGGSWGYQPPYIPAHPGPHSEYGPPLSHMMPHHPHDPRNNHPQHSPSLDPAWSYESRYMATPPSSHLNYRHATQNSTPENGSSHPDEYQRAMMVDSPGKQLQHESGVLAVGHSGPETPNVKRFSDSNENTPTEDSIVRSNGDIGLDSHSRSKYSNGVMGPSTKTHLQSSGSKSDLEPPGKHYEMIKKAIESSATQDLDANEITHWIRQNFSYYQQKYSFDDCLNSVSATLSQRKKKGDFLKHDPLPSSGNKRCRWSIPKKDQSESRISKIQTPKNVAEHQDIRGSSEKRKTHSPTVPRSSQQQQQQQQTLQDAISTRLSPTPRSLPSAELVSPSQQNRIPSGEDYQVKLNYSEKYRIVPRYKNSLPWNELHSLGSARHNSNLYSLGDVVKVRSENGADPSEDFASIFELKVLEEDHKPSKKDASHYIAAAVLWCQSKEYSLKKAGGGRKLANEWPDGIDFMKTNCLEIISLGAIARRANTQELERITTGPKVLDVSNNSAKIRNENAKEVAWLLIHETAENTVNGEAGLHSLHAPSTVEKRRSTRQTAKPAGPDNSTPTKLSGDRVASLRYKRQRGSKKHDLGEGNVGETFEQLQKAYEDLQQEHHKVLRENRMMLAENHKHVLAMGVANEEILNLRQSIVEKELFGSGAFKVNPHRIATDPDDIDSLLGPIVDDSDWIIYSSLSEAASKMYLAGVSGARKPTLDVTHRQMPRTAPYCSRTAGEPESEPHKERAMQLRKLYGIRKHIANELIHRGQSVLMDERVRRMAKQRGLPV